MNLFELALGTPAATPALTLAEAKAHLRVETAFTDDDGLITAQAAAAQAYVEAALTWRALTPRGLIATFDCFPSSGELWLPFPPVSALSELATLDAAGIATVIPASSYRLDVNLGRVTLTGAWPAGRVRATYTAGFTAVPAALKAALLLFLGHLYENRETVAVGSGLTALDVPWSVAALCAPYKAYRPGGA